MDREYILRQIRLIQSQCEINAKRSEEIDNFLFGDLRNEIEKINRDKEDEEFTIYKFKLQNKE